MTEQRSHKVSKNSPKNKLTQSTSQAFKISKNVCVEEISKKEISLPFIDFKTEP